MNVFPQYIAVQSRVSRFSWSLYSAQTLDQAICWRSKMCFQKFIIYILRYTHRKAPFIRTWVLAIQYVRKKKWYVQSNPTSEVCEFGAQISAFFGACRLQRARYANCLAEIQRESSNCETKGEWIFALKNLNQISKICVQWFPIFQIQWEKL